MYSNDREIAIMSASQVYCDNLSERFALLVFKTAAPHNHIMLYYNMILGEAVSCMVLLCALLYQKPDLFNPFTFNKGSFEMQPHTSLSATL